MVLGYVVTGLALGAAYSLLAVAVVLVFNGTRVLSVAMGEIGAFGLYCGLWLSKHGVPWHLGGFAVGITAVVVGGLLALVLERVVMRQLVGRAPLDGLIATLGIALTLALLEAKLFGVNPVSSKAPLGDGKFKVFGAYLSTAKVAELVLAAAVAAGLYLFLSRTQFGLSTRAATSDPTVARLLGVKVNDVYRFSWLVAGMLSGAAAALFIDAGQLSAFSQTKFALAALAGAVIGGLDSLQGAIVGSLLVGVTESVVGPTLGDGYKSGVVLVMVLAVLVVRPRGLFGTASAA